MTKEDSSKFPIYTASDVHPVQITDKIFFGSSGATPMNLIGCVLSDVSMVNSEELRVFRKDSYCLVVCDVDWMPSIEEGNISNLFDKAHPKIIKPEIRSVRSEWLLNQFCEGVLAFGGLGDYYSAGLTKDDLPIDLGNCDLKHRRALAWKGRRAG